MNYSFVVSSIKSTLLIVLATGTLGFAFGSGSCFGEGGAGFRNISNLLAFSAAPLNSIDTFPSNRGLMRRTDPPAYVSTKSAKTQFEQSMPSSGWTTLLKVASYTLALSGGTFGSTPEKVIPVPAVDCAPVVVEIPTATSKQSGATNFDTEKQEPVEFFIESSVYDGVVESCPQLSDVMEYYILHTPTTITWK